MKTTIQHFENRAGGKGWIHIEHLLDSDALGSHVKMYARVTIDPHASIGVYHLHQGDGESYLIEKGTALYHADGVTRTLHPGDQYLDAQRASSRHRKSGRGRAGADRVIITQE